MEVWTESLLSKWGLEDGDILVPILDELGFDLGVVNTHDILIELIKDLVIAKIENEVEFEVVGTFHNPIRITRVDGKAIDHLSESHPDIHLRPESVEVSDDVIRDYANQWLAREGQRQ